MPAGFVELTLERSVVALDHCKQPVCRSGDGAYRLLLNSTEPSHCIAHGFCRLGDCFERHVSVLLGAVLQLCEGADYYGHPVVRDEESLWGLEWDIDGKYLEEICQELYHEIDSRSKSVV